MAVLKGESSLSDRYLCVSNNPNVILQVGSESSLYVDGGGCDVLLQVRDFVHRGSELLTHPLYGNFHPKKHPFRSAIVMNVTRDTVDHDSLALVERALAICCEKKDEEVLAKDISEKIAADFAMLDYELIKESLKRYRLLKRV